LIGKGQKLKIRNMQHSVDTMKRLQLEGSSLRHGTKKMQIFRIANALDEQIVGNKSPEALRNGASFDRRVLNTSRNLPTFTASPGPAIACNSSCSRLPALTGRGNPTSHPNGLSATLQM
jgi:hypothetical protein